MCPDGMIRRCVYGSKTQKILDECHHDLTRGHYGPSTTAKKVFDAGFYWPIVSRKLILSFKIMMLANVLVASHEEMRCLKIASKLVKYLAYRELISWDHSLNPISSNTFSLLLITYLKGQKTKVLTSVTNKWRKFENDVEFTIVLLQLIIHKPMAKLKITEP
ncbi:hypothetical protein Tco_1410654 [Tanacetum coccineum]